MRNSIARQGSQKCAFNSAKITNSNKLVVEQFILCKSNIKKARPIKMFKIICNDTKHIKTSKCPTFLEVRENTIECSKICWTFPFDFIVLCNKKPKSNVLRNCMILLISLCIVIAGTCIGKNWYAIKVSC